MSNPSSSDLRNIVDTVSAVLDSLAYLGTNAMVIHLVLSKVDSDSKSKWDEQWDYKKLPSWEDFSSILIKKCKFIEMNEDKSRLYVSNSSNNWGSNKSKSRNNNGNNNFRSNSNQIFARCIYWPHKSMFENCKRSTSSKKGDPSDPGNYRHIVICSNLAKVMESILKLMKYLEDNSLLNDRQVGVSRMTHSDLVKIEEN